MSDTNNNPVAPAAIDKAIASVCQAMAVIRITSESLLEPEDFEIAATRAHEALDGAHALLDNVLGHIEDVANQLRGKVTP